jgi:hypothetical protein
MNEHTTHQEREVASRRQWWGLGCCRWPWS